MIAGFRIVLAAGVATLALGARPATAASDAATAFIEAMIRNVGMIQVDCPVDTAPPPSGGSSVCLGPYWMWKDFRRVWDGAAGDPRRVPAVPVPVSSWESTGESYSRRYRLATGAVDVFFDKKRQSVMLTSRPDAVAATPPPAAPYVAGPAAVAAAATGESEPDPGATPEVAPVVIPSSRVAPRYPPAARPLRLSARVVLTVIVGPDSAVEGVIVDSCSNPGRGFEDAAVEAVSKWKFRAGLRNDEPVRGQTRVTVLFSP